MLLAATIVEYSVWQTTTLSTGVFAVFPVLFFANLALYFFAMFALAFADGGVAGSSTIGKIGLIVFGMRGAVQQLVHWTSYFVASLPMPLDVLNTVALVVTYLGVIAAAAVIAVGRTVRGLARWALIIGFAIAAVCAGIANAGSDEVLTTALLSVSSAAQAFVGLS